MLHLVFEAKPDDRQDTFHLRPVLERLQKREHLLVDVIAISNSVLNRRSRTGAALGPFDARAEAFVIGVEIEEILFGIDVVAGLMRLQERLEKP